MARFGVQILQEAEQDLRQTLRWVSINDSPIKARSLIEKLIKCCITLEELPYRGHTLKELERIAVKDYLEIHQGPYRIIYQVREQTVFIHAVLDGRRDLLELLEKRLLRL